MDIFTINMDHFSDQEIQQLYIKMEPKIHSLHKEQDHKKQVCEILLNNKNLVCKAVLPTFQLTKHSAIIYRILSKTLADFIINHLQMKYILNIIKKKHPHFNQTEILKLKKYCSDLLNESSKSSKLELKKQQKITDCFLNFIDKNTWINLEAFIRFRLQFFYQELDEVVEYAIEEYISDQQYKEFMTLLKTFVYTQEYKIPSVHIIHNGENDFLVLNEQLKTIEINGEETISEVDDHHKNNNFDDLIITKLVSISPKKIVIHTREPELQIIHVIEQIFEERTFICERCNVCEKMVADDQKMEK